MKQPPKELIKEAHALAQSIPYAMTLARKRDLKLRILAALGKAFKNG